MSKHFAASMAVLLATTAIARAEVDARTIWSDWQQTVQRFGVTLSAASEDFAGDTLTLRDVTAASVVPGTRSSTGYGTITMVEQDDGTVRIVLPASVESTQQIRLGDATAQQTVTVASEGLSVVASEEAGLRAYALSADAITATVDQTGAGDIPPSLTTMTLSDMASTYRSGIGGEAGAFDQSISAGTAAVAFEGGASADLPVTVGYTARALTGDVTGRYGPARSGPVTSLSDLGLVYDGRFRHSGSTLTVAGTAPQGAYAVDGTSASGETRTALGDAAFVSAIRSADAAMQVKVPMFPVPIDLSMAGLAFSTTLPMGEPAGEQPFALSVALRDLVVDDAIWALFDPTGQLPRDPATASLDLDGTAAMAVDMFGDPAVLAARREPPGEIRSLTLNDLTLAIAGATLRGTGAVTFPEPEPGPVPEPVGTVELSLDGGFALIDKLVALGFLPAEQAAFVKGMSGAVTRQVGDDRLQSTIEFTPGGGISANGLPLK